ncbi:hypothetical protein K2X40_00125 [Candidatus Babeliales bacterium]|nr:hypothetical protein [Candidatus Babeliales bacterium]
MKRNFFVFCVLLLSVGSVFAAAGKYTKGGKGGRRSKSMSPKSQRSRSTFSDSTRLPVAFACATTYLGLKNYVKFEEILLQYPQLVNEQALADGKTLEELVEECNDQTAITLIREVRGRHDLERDLACESLSQFEN